MTGYDANNANERKTETLYSTIHNALVPESGVERSNEIYIYADRKEQFISNKCANFEVEEQKKEMLLCQTQPNDHVQDHEVKTEKSSIFITAKQLATLIDTHKNNHQQNFLIIDCGSPLRHAETHIKDSFLLNANDRLSLKRLSTRGLANFLNSAQLERLDRSKIIILYDDRIHATSCSVSDQQMSPAMQCIFDQISSYSKNKHILILQCKFDQFYQQYPSLCLSAPTMDDLPAPCPAQATETVDFLQCEMSEIFPGMYLGNQQDAANLELLKQNHINSVINVSKSVPCYFADDKTFDYLHISCDDSSLQDILQFFESTFDWIHKKLLDDQRILVHCQAGISRSPSFVIGYLMKYKGKTFEQAYEFVKSRRSIVNPNINFIGQLSLYQRNLNSS